MATAWEVGFAESGPLSEALRAIVRLGVSQDLALRMALAMIPWGCEE